MKILFLGHLFPLPLDSGGKIKSFFAIKALASKHEVRVLTFVRGEDERNCVPELEKVCASVEVVDLKRSVARRVYDAVSSLAFGRSFIMSRDFRPEMLRAYQDAVADFQPDVVHIDHLQMAPFVEFDGRYRTVLDQHNVESVIIHRIAETTGHPAVRWYAGVEWPKLQRCEMDACLKSDLVLTVSDEDRDTLRRLDPSLEKVESVPIGIDTENIQIVQRDLKSRNILFLGTMYWPPNIDCVLYFCRDILPWIRKQLPDVRFTIAGQRPTPAVVALAKHPAVSVTGYVSDVSESAKDCGVFVVPLRSGSGVRVKILNAMAMGLPIVSTSIGAEGIDVVNGEHILIADKPSDFANAVLRVLNEPGLAEKLVRNASELVCRNYSWDVAGKHLLGLYEKYLER